MPFEVCPFVCFCFLGKYDIQSGATGHHHSGNREQNNIPQSIMRRCSSISLSSSFICLYRSSTTPTPSMTCLAPLLAHHVMAHRVHAFPSSTSSLLVHLFPFKLVYLIKDTSGLVTFEVDISTSRRLLAILFFLDIFFLVVLLIVQ